MGVIPHWRLLHRGWTAMSEFQVDVLTWGWTRWPLGSLPTSSLVEPEVSPLFEHSIIQPFPVRYETYCNLHSSWQRNRFSQEELEDSLVLNMELRGILVTKELLFIWYGLIQQPEFLKPPFEGGWQRELSWRTTALPTLPVTPLPTLQFLKSNLSHQAQMALNRALPSSRIIL